MRRHCPAANCAKGCDYALRIWTRLEVLLEHGEVELATNLAENAMRPVALERNNRLHIGDENAGTKIAAILSVWATCGPLESIPATICWPCCLSCGPHPHQRSPPPHPDGLAPRSPRRSRTRQPIATAHPIGPGYPQWSCRVDTLGGIKPVFAHEAFGHTGFHKGSVGG